METTIPLPSPAKQRLPANEPVRHIERVLTFRHSVWVRATHWTGAICIIGLLMSGMQIFNAHPSLYFGKASDFDHPVLSIDTNDDQSKGVTTFGGNQFDTTGILGLSGGLDGAQTRAFPAWMTLPGEQDLATGRRWHFMFAWILVANGFVYLIYSLISRHLTRDIVPGLREFAHIPRAVWDHLRLRFNKGDEARRYNILQKLTYAGLILIVMPVLVLAGMAMSPGLDAAFPWLLSLFGGRQSARTIHFMMASLVFVFVIVHLVMVFVSGFGNNIRAMTTGRFTIEKEED